MRSAEIFSLERIKLFFQFAPAEQTDSTTSQKWAEGEESILNILIGYASIVVKNETFIFEKNIAKILETLFSDIDSYYGDPQIANYDPSDPFADINELELKKGQKLPWDNWIS